MQIEFAVETLVGIAITVFFSFLGLVVAVLYKIALGVEVQNSTLERIERDINTLTRIFPRGRSTPQSLPEDGTSESRAQQPDTDSTQTDGSVFTQSDERETPSPFFGNLDVENESNRMPSFATRMGDMSVVIHTWLGNNVTIFEIKPEELERRIAEAEAVEDVDLGGIPHPYLDTNIQPAIEELSHDIFGAGADVVYDSLTVLIIVPSTDEDDIKRFGEGLIDLLRTHVKQ